MNRLSDFGFRQPNLKCTAVPTDEPDAAELMAYGLQRLNLGCRIYARSDRAASFAARKTTRESVPACALLAVS